jgi:hypothetical protein
VGTLHTIGTEPGKRRVLIATQRRGRHAMTCWTRIFDFWLPGDALPMMPLEGELGGYHGPLNDQPRRRNENGLIYQLK